MGIQDEAGDTVRVFVRSNIVEIEVTSDYNYNFAVLAFKDECRAERFRAGLEELLAECLKKG